MAKVVDEDGNVSIGRPILQPGNRGEPQLNTTDWVRSFVIAPKRSINDAPVRPFSTVYTREREVYEKGQRLSLTEYQTQAEYVMSILKDETA